MRFNNSTTHLPYFLKSIRIAISIGYTGPYLLGIDTKISSIAHPYASYTIVVNLVDDTAEFQMRNSNQQC